jgi:hypothetical protein
MPGNPNPSQINRVPYIKLADMEVSFRIPDEIARQLSRFTLTDSSVSTMMFAIRAVAI